MKTVRAAIAAIALTTAATAVAAAPAGAENIGNEGCTPGYWKNHEESWQIPGVYFPRLKLQYLGLEFPTRLSSYANTTMMQALQGGGGSGLDGAAKILLRADGGCVLERGARGRGIPVPPVHGRRDPRPGERRARELEPADDAEAGPEARHREQPRLSALTFMRGGVGTREVLTPHPGSCGSRSSRASALEGWVP